MFSLSFCFFLTENSFCIPEGEEMVLEFRNSVSEASITLTEVDFPPPPEEDMVCGGYVVT